MAEGGNLKCIPVIDMQEMEDVKQYYKKLREASEEWGCFRIVNHNIPASLMSEMKKVVKELLGLPMEIKKRNTDVIAGSGYVALSNSNPLYEALGLYDLGPPEVVRAFCSQLDASPQQRFL
jgi:isopenicillin N synthase-like dioxygenase